MKKTVTQSVIAVAGLVFALSSVAPKQALAFGPSKPQSDEITNKSEYLEAAIREFNEKNADVSIGSSRTDDVFGEAEANQWAYPYLENARSSLCSKLAPVIAPGSTCSDLVQVQSRVYQTTDSTYITPKAGFVVGCVITLGLGCLMAGGDSWNYDRHYVYSPHAQFSAALTDKGATLARSTFFNDSSNTAVDYNVRAIQTALMNLQLLPSQRKTIDGFWNAAATFTTAIEQQKQKEAKGERALPLTHRVFVEQSNLLVSYYRYLKGDLAELAQFGSAAGGVSRSNREAVDVIANSIQHLSEAYGLEADLGSKQVADYGRVLVDLMNNFAQPLTLKEKTTFIQPVMAELVTHVIPASEAYGDVGAHNAVLTLKSLWESDTFEQFLEEKLSASDEKAVNLILNMSALTYKLGLSANVEIRTFDARDAQRIKAQRPLISN